MNDLESDDLADGYLSHAQGTTSATSAAEMEEWTRTWEADQNNPRPPLIEPIIDKTEGIKARPLPEPKPARQPTDDEIGRVEPQKESTGGTVMRNIAEIPGQFVSGADSAVQNALSFADPLVDWLNENVADLRITKPQPKTTTGKIVHGLSEFFTGFIPALKGLRAIGMTSNVAAPVVAGALAEFTVRGPHEKRLSDLWKEMELPETVLTEFLSSKPGDDEMDVYRFKNAIEGAGLGALAEGVFQAARLIRAIKKTPGVKETEEAILKAKYGEISDSDLARIVGDPSKPSIEIRARKPSVVPGKVEDALEAVGTPDPRQLMRKQGSQLPEDWDVFINFARIDEPDKIKFVIGKMAEKMKGRIDEARRGTITHEETVKLADQLGMTVMDLLKRRKGQGFNAEEAVAARELWAASADKLLEFAKKAAGPNAGPLDQFAFRQQMAVHAAIQSEVIGARTETARALASWRIPVGGSNIERARAIEQITQAMGGPETSRDMAKRLAILAEVGDPAAFAKFAERGWGAKTADAVREVWVNGLLSSPTTHAVNVTSNLLVAAQQLYERAAAAGIRQVLGGEGTELGESAAMALGGVEAIKDAFRLSAKALKTGETGWAFNKVDTPTARAVSSEAFNMSRETGLGRFVDFLGSTMRVPQRLLGAEDEFFKTIGYRMELRAQAFRTAKQEGHTGDALAKRYAELSNNPTDAMRINAADAALYNTFTNEMGAFGRSVMNLRNIDHPLNPLMFVLPFVRTPVNIARYAFERTPFAPLVSQWRADIAAGGARADLALARMSTGTAIMTVAMDWADKGIVSGDGPKHEDKDVREAMLRQGWQPYSVKIGNRWYSYNRTDPLGMTLGFAASITEAIKKGEIDEEDVDEWQEVAAMSIAAVSQVTISKTYLEGFSKLVETLSDPRRYSQKYIDDLVASFTPATALNSAVKNMVDPVQREVSTPMEAIQARIAGLSSKLPPRRDLWGKEITSESGLGGFHDFMSPIKSKQQEPTAIDRELVRLNSGPLRISKRAVFDGVMANMRHYPQVYDDYVKLAGNELKHPAWGMGAKDFLNSVVEGKSPISAAYNVMSDESRRSFIQGTISDYRKLAQREVLQNPKHKNFAAEITRLKEIHREAKLPVLE